MTGLSSSLSVRRAPWRATLALCLTATTLVAQPAKRITSSDMRVSPTRITKTFSMAKRDGLTVTISVIDHGGSTDVSPTEQAVLTIYLKGELYNVDAAFDLGMFFDVQSATRREAGVYEIRAISVEPDPTFGAMNLVTLRVDARQATVDARAVRCDELDCDAAERFRTAITVTRQVSALPR